MYTTLYTTSLLRAVFLLLDPVVFAPVVDVNNIGRKFRIRRYYDGESHQWFNNVRQLQLNSTEAADWASFMFLEPNVRHEFDLTVQVPPERAQSVTQAVAAGEAQLAVFNDLHLGNIFVRSKYVGEIVTIQFQDGSFIKAVIVAGSSPSVTVILDWSTARDADGEPILEPMALNNLLDGESGPINTSTDLQAFLAEAAAAGVPIYIVTPGPSPNDQERFECWIEDGRLRCKVTIASDIG